MVCEPTSEATKSASRRYRREMAIAAIIYVSFVFAAALAIRNFDLPHWAVIVLSLLPTAPALLMLRAYLTYVSALDEFQRSLHVRALIVATALVVFGSFAYGFLEEWAAFPHLPLLWVFPVFSVTFGLAHIVIRRRYK
ncbi:MAG: hypothetical protein AB7O98_17640 [Hyphomonadaceae bacterium]